MKSSYAVFRRCITLCSVLRLTASKTDDARIAWLVLWFFTCWSAGLLGASIGQGKLVSIAVAIVMVKRKFNPNAYIHSGTLKTSTSVRHQSDFGGGCLKIPSAAFILLSLKTA
jgi:hypothetical protein